MRMIPPLLALGLLPLLGRCGETEAPPDEPTAALPFDSAPLSPGEQRLVSAAGDTMRLFALAPRDGRQQLVTTHAGSTDSISVLVDAATKTPIESYRRASAGEGDTMTARIEYGQGFEGQARLTLSAPQRRGIENLRTPAPSLDAGQLPLTLAALPFGTVDSLHFNYVAPFEKRALAALLVVGTLDTVRVGGEALAAWPVLLRVSGLEERAWYAAQPPHALVRLEELTRRRTWTRVP